MSEKKHHYRNVFKSDHLGSADLEDLIEQGSKLIFTIKEVKQFIGEVQNGKVVNQALVAGKKIDANIAYFHENIKPLVLNATNSKILKSFTINPQYPNGNPFTEDWKNITVELYIDENVQMKGVKTQGVRIRPIQPQITKSKPVFSESNFEAAKKANATKEQILSIYELSEEVYNKFLEYGK